MLFNGDASVIHGRCACVPTGRRVGTCGTGRYGTSRGEEMLPALAGGLRKGSSASAIEGSLPERSYLLTSGNTYIQEIY